MFGTVAVAVGAGIAGLLGIASRRPDTFIVRRSVSIGAAPHHIYSFLDDFRRWRLWSPWEDVDPDLQRTYGGASAGMGATYQWAGKKAGAGRMEITEVSPPRRLGIELDFTKPFKASNRIEFTLEEGGGATTVNWVMTGTSGLGSKVMGLFVSMDRLVGKDFEKGLARLKTAAEGSGAPASMTPPTL